MSVRCDNVGFVVILGAIWLSPHLRALAVCPQTPGDLDGSGEVTVADVQCAILFSLWNLAGADGKPPECVTVPVANTDVNCSGKTDVADILLMIQTVLGVLPSPALDQDSDGCLDGCQQNDGFCSPFECTAYPPDCCKPNVVCSSDPCALGPACDGTVACGGKPCPAGDFAPCDDSDPCTFGNTCKSGICSAGFPLKCDDLNECTIDTCDPDAGCLHIPVPGCICVGAPVPKAVDCCWPHSTSGCAIPQCAACVCAKQPYCCNTAWDDGCKTTAATTCLPSCAECGPLPGNCCQTTASKGCAYSPCADCVCAQNPSCCTTAWTTDCVKLSSAFGICGQVCGCGGPPENPAFGGAPICAVSGAPGSHVNCPLQVVSGHTDYPLAITCQWSIAYDPGVLSFGGVWDTLCFGPQKSPPCVEVLVSGKPGGFALANGYPAILEPFLAAEWNGFGGILLVNPWDSQAVVTKAWADPCGNIVGSPYVLNLRFELKKDVPTQSPVWVHAPLFLAATFGPEPLHGAWWPDKQAFVTWPK